jgi:hypothetical protein
VNIVMCLPRLRRGNIILWTTFVYVEPGCAGMAGFKMKTAIVWWLLNWRNNESSYVVFVHILVCLINLCKAQCDFPTPPWVLTAWSECRSF